MSSSPPPNMRRRRNEAAEKQQQMLRRMKEQQLEEEQEQAILREHNDANLKHALSSLFRGLASLVIIGAVALYYVSPHHFWKILRLDDGLCGE